MIEKSKETIEVDVYKTTDGVTFQSKQEAVDHQRALELLRVARQRPYGYADRGRGYEIVRCEQNTLINFVKEIIFQAGKMSTPKIIEKDSTQ